jgi:histidinol-phosphate aminotransferase
MSLTPKTILLNEELVRPDTFRAIPRDKKMLWLDKNENMDLIQTQLIKSICNNIDPMILSTYPEAAEAYGNLSEWLGVLPECILFTPGSDGAIRMTFETFVEQGETVIYTNPTFAMYPVYSKMFGAVSYELNYNKTESGPEIFSSDIINTVRKLRPKLLCLPNPDSPTGTVISEDEIRDILGVCEETGSLLLVDEAYHPFYSWTAVPLVETSKNIIVARTFAKAWGAAGLRVGYAVGHPDTIKFLHKMRPMYEVSSFAIEFVANALKYAKEMEISVNRTMEGKAFFVESLKNLGFSVIDTYANFVHVDFADKGKLIHEALSKEVLYRQSFDHPCLEGYSRFTVAPKKIMQKVLLIIEIALEGNQINE